MPLSTSKLPFAKPPKRVKVRKPLRRTRLRPSRKAQQRRREESKVVKVVRLVVAERDGYCRLHWTNGATRAAMVATFGPCHGASQWAHRREGMSRAQTRGMDPKDRHTTAGSLMLCAFHHLDDRHGYDRSAFAIEDMTDKGCDGRLRFVTRAGQALEEPA